MSPPRCSDIEASRISSRSDGVTLAESDRHLPPRPPQDVVSENPDHYLVQFDENDPMDAKTWGRGKRWYITALAGILVLNATFASTAPSNIVEQIMEGLHFGEEVASLLTGIFVLGFAFGPIVCGPLSEQVGRKPVLVIAFLFYTGWQVGCALSPNTVALIVFRFLGGLFASAPLTISGAIISDIWDTKTRGIAMTSFSLAPFAGPALGPNVAGWIAQSGTNWRWIFWVTTCFAGACLVFIVFTLPETYAPVILTRKAKKLRKETGDSGYYSALEARKRSLGERARTIIVSPFQMLVEEPMLAAITVYMSFVYGCLYLLFESYPIVFTQDHNLNPGVSGLMFVPFFLGGFAGCIFYLVFYHPRYVRYMDEYAPNFVPPEKRLEVTLVAAPIFSIAFFWFGWTSYSWIPFWSSMMAGSLLGFSILLIFFTQFNFIVDTYLVAAATALSANTIVRSVVGAAFPLFARQLFDSLNPRWASTLLGCFAALMAPIPFLLTKYGPALRKRSKFVPQAVQNTKSAKPDEKV
ncbi:MFS general substrate transporter [Peniophora sp. CONT]|nr:MFS general substrate transporter [Peniophora sp. CONT]